MKFLDYIKGFRKGKDARRIELDSMYDPFLEEAIEGYDSVQGDHMKRILEMQRKVSRKASPKGRKYFLSVASVAASVLLIAYFTVFDRFGEKSSLSESILASDYSLDKDLYVYIPEDYVKKVQMKDISVSPTVDIDNINELLEPSGIDIYIPEEYVERKRQKNYDKKFHEKETPAIILNLDEILLPEEPINIYVPEGYLKKKNLNS